MLKKYIALMRRSVGVMLEYRASVLIWMLVNVMPLVMLAVWFSLSESGPIGGYSQSDFVSYYLLLAFMRQMTTVWVIWELDNDIRHGELSIKLLHPLNPLHEYISYNLADKILRLIVLLPFAVLAWMIFPTIYYDVTPLNVTLFVITLAAAWFMRFMSQYTFGLLAFWVSEAMTLHEIWFGMWMMLGGLIAPLDLFPVGVAAVAKFLPFRFMLSFPVEIMLGRLTAEELVIGLAAAVFWVLAMLAVYRWLWRKGLTQFSAFGA
jgi:ABC-2 type transport system permease protein